MNLTAKQKKQNLTPGSLDVCLPKIDRILSNYVIESFQRKKDITRSQAENEFWKEVGSRYGFKVVFSGGQS